MMHSTIKSKLKKILRSALVALFWITLWELAARYVNREIILPSPLTVFLRLIGLTGNSGFWRTVAMSLIRILSGYLLGVFAGIAVAVATVYVKPLRALLSPLLTVIRAVPVASFILLVLVWIGNARVPVFTAFLMVLPVMWSTVSTAISALDPALGEVARLYNFPLLKKLRLYVIPSVTPALLSAAVTSLGLAWKAGVAAEVLCTPRDSIGKYIYESKIYLETPDLFAWTVVVVLLSLLLENAVSYAVKRLKFNGGARHD